MSSTIRTDGSASSDTTIPTTVSVRSPADQDRVPGSPAREALRIDGGSAGRPSGRSSLKVKVIRFHPFRDRTA
jgi:hypothetical protein